MVALTLGGALPWLLFSAGGMVTALVAPVPLPVRTRSGGSTRPTTGTYCDGAQPDHRLLCWIWWHWPCSMRRTGSGSCSTMGCTGAGSTE